MSKVYFVKIEDFGNHELILERLKLLFKESGLTEVIKPAARVAVKISFGEEENAGFINPNHVACVVSEITKCDARPFVTDSNTIYHGKRSNAIDHLNLAYKHGFTPSSIGAPILIADGLIGADFRQIEIKKKHFRYIKVASAACDCDCIIGLSHMTGHMLTGFGGAIKNIGMGLASRAGKLAQHSNVAPKVDKEKCIGCGICVKVCPANATCLVKKKAYIHKERCIGCGECLIRCSAEAIDLEWSENEKRVQEKMAEYAYGILKDKEKGFVSFLNHITAECDCLAKDDPKIANDFGILASLDPIALDKASCDVITKASGEDVFMKAHPKTDWHIQLDYGQKLGLGSTEYELIEVS